jgi:mono/diheme cytochrome c family protein
MAHLFVSRPCLVGLLALAALCACKAESPAQDRVLQDDITALRQQGAVYATENCSRCHAVERGETRSPNPLAPTFVVIGSTPGMTLMALNAALHTPHVAMPNLKVDPNAIEPLSAYISSLKDPEVTRRLREEESKRPTLKPLGG